MSTLTRRNLCQSLPLLAMLPSFAAEAQAAAPKNCVEPLLADCATFPFDSLPVHPSSNGGASRPIVEGRIPGLDHVELHETTLPPGQMPHPPHRHPHAEFLLIRQGTLEFLTDGPPRRVTAGDTIYNAPNKLHGVRNVGDVDALYFVVAIGPGAACPK